MGTAHSRWPCGQAPEKVRLTSFLLVLQLERRARLRKLLAEMDEDEKVDRLGERHTPPRVLKQLAHRLYCHRVVQSQYPVL